MIRTAILVLLLTSSACVGDRLWVLRSSAELPHPLATDCIREALARLPGVDSVPVSPVLVTASAARDSIASGMQFLVVAHSPFYGPVVQHTKTDSSATLSVVWMRSGWKPPRDSIDYHKDLHATILKAVAGDCARINPTLKVVEGDRL